jgi:hypothetical protein
VILAGDGISSETIWLASKGFVREANETLAETMCRATRLSGAPTGSRPELHYRLSVLVCEALFVMLPIPQNGEARQNID